MIVFRNVARRRDKQMMLLLLLLLVVMMLMSWEARGEKVQVVQALGVSLSGRMARARHSHCHYDYHAHCAQAFAGNTSSPVAAS